MLDKLVKALTLLLAVALVSYMIFLKLPGASASSKEVVAEISAENIYTAYTNDEKAAQGKYLGKAIVISGLLYDKYDDETGAPVILLGPTDGEPYALITLESSQRSMLDSHEIGDKISIKAICTGMLMEVTLNKGLIQ